MKHSKDESGRLDKEINRLLSRSRVTVGVSNFADALCRLLPIAIYIAVAFLLMRASAHRMQEVLPFMAWALVIVGAAAVVVATFWGTSLRRVAIRLDREMGLSDRIASALEFSSLERPSLFMRCQIAETGHYIRSLDPFPVLPFRMPRSFKPALFSVLALALLWSMADQLLSLRFPDMGAGYSVPERIAEAEQKLVEFSARLAPAEAELFEKVALPAFRELARRGLLKPRPPVQRRVPGAPGKSVKKAAPPPEGEVTLPGGLESLPGGELGQGEVAGGVPAGRELLPAQILDIFTQAGGVFMQQQSMTSRLGSLAKLSGLSGQLKDIQMSFLPLLAPPKVPKPLERREEEMNAAMLQSFAEYLNLYTSAMAEKWTHEDEDLSVDEDGRRGPGIHFSIPDELKKGLKAEDASEDELAGAKTRFEEMDLPFSNANIEKLKMFYSNKPPQKGPTFAMQAKGAGTQAGASGAGRGESAADVPMEAAPPTEESAEVQYEPIEGRMGTGEASVQILEEIGQYRFKDRTLDRYDDLFVEYSRQAEETLAEEPIPAVIKRFVKTYFEAIRPGAGEERERETDQ